jgi:hypothetical protein
LLSLALIGAACGGSDRHVADAAAMSPDTMAPTFGQQGYVKASNTSMNAEFGDALALSSDGSTLAVAAVRDASSARGVGGNQSDRSVANSGAVYIFTRKGTTWAQQAFVKASNTGENDFFGASIALSADGSTLAVGAEGESSAATGIGGDQLDNSKVNSGAVYVFTRTDAQWSQQAYVKASNTDAGDIFGLDVALSSDGSTLAVGAEGEASSASGIDGNQADNSGRLTGAVYVFSRTDSTWTQQAYIKASNANANDFFGVSLALSADGSTLAVGACFEASSAKGIDGDQGDNTSPNSGAAYVFRRAGATWMQEAYVKASNAGVADNFGFSVALSPNGAILAVGADGEESAAIGIDGSQTDNSASASGAVYVFKRAGATWIQQAYVKPSNTNSSDVFGISVALSSDATGVTTLMVGAQGEDSSAVGIDGNQLDNSTSAAGAAYVFVDATAQSWEQRTYLKASNTDVGDGFGSSVAVALGGSLVAVSAKNEDSSATGIDGDQTNDMASSSGAVYVFTAL